MAKKIIEDTIRPRIEIPKEKVDLEALGLINQGLFPVTGQLARRYNEVLKHVFDLDCDIDSFRVDKRGLSPELAEYMKKKYGDRIEFGENYLNIKSANRYMVVVSPDQKSAPLVFPQTSYEDGLYDEVYRQARHTIEYITQTGALFGELDNGINIFRSAEDLLQFRTVEISLDTLDGAVGSFFELRNLAKDLGNKGKDGLENSLNPEYIQRIQSLVKKVGNIRDVEISKVFPITKEIHCFYVEFFQGVHCLRNFRNKEEVKTLFISHHQETKWELGEGIVNFDLHDPELIQMLHKYRFLEYDERLIDSRLREIENEAMLAAGVDIVDLTVPQRKRKIIELTATFPESWHELKDLAQQVESGSMGLDDAIKDKELKYETKVKLSTPSSKDEIINHLLAEIDPTDIRRVYEFNRRKFVTEFPKLPLNRQRYLAHALLNDTGGKTK